MRAPVLSLLLILSPFHVALPDDWPWWRGPDRNGIAAANQDPPIEFNKENLRWSSDLPGRSHGSMIAVGDSLFLLAATEDNPRQLLLNLDRSNGTIRWSCLLHEGGFTQKLNKKATWASSTPAFDGKFIFAPFVNGDHLWLSAVDLEGDLVWQQRVSPYVIHQGYASSPAIYKDLVIVTADNKGGGAVCAYDRETGKEVWRVARAKMPNYASPIILEAGGIEQLFLTGTERVTSLNPKTGETNWEIEGSTTECVTSTVTDGKHIYSSGGYPKNHVAAIVADGSGEIAWEVNDRVYVPSMLIHEGHLYAVMDSGVGICWDSATGEEKWKARIGGTFSASPVLVGDQIFAVNEAGELTVFQASSSGYKEISKSKVADEVLATPTFVGGKVYVRGAFYQGERRTERLLCFEKP